MWDETLMKDCEEKDQIERFIKQLENPFGFLDQIQLEAEDTDDDDEEEEGPESKSKMESLMRQQTKTTHGEKQVIQSIDVISHCKDPPV